MYCFITFRIFLVNFQDAFYEQFKDLQDETEKCWWNGILYTTLGLGTLAAVLYVKS